MNKNKIIKKLNERTGSFKLMFYKDLINQVKIQFKQNFCSDVIQTLAEKARYSDSAKIALLIACKNDKEPSDILEVIEVIAEKDDFDWYPRRFKKEDGLLFDTKRNEYYVSFVIKKVISERPMIHGIMTTKKELKNRGIMMPDYGKSLDSLNVERILLNIKTIYNID